MSSFKLGPTFKKARTAKLLGIKPEIFGVYPVTLDDAFKLGIHQLDINGEIVNIFVLTNVASSITNPDRRMYQVARLV